MTSTPAEPFRFATKTPKGRHSSVFQSPKSPGLTAPSPSINRLNSGSRKRARADSTQKDRASRLPDHRTRQTHHQCPTPSQDGAEDTSEGILVNERYRLAGGFDTPSARAATATESLRPAFDDLGRRSRDVASGHDGYFPAMPLSGPLARERNGSARLASTEQSTQPGTSWAVFAVGLVSKVFTFGTGVIKGFYSGGGQGYDLAGERELRHETPADHSDTEISTPIPGSWMGDTWAAYAHPNHTETFESPNRPSHKRRQTDKDEWVVVSPSAGHETTRRRMSLSSKTGLSVRPQPASRATSRHSLAPAVTRRQSSFTYTSPGSPGHDLRASMAPTRSPGNAPKGSPGTGYFSPEAERHVKRQAKQDMKINHISRQLEDLIRQGQEALGTKVSVESTDTDEGYDGDW